MTAEIVIMNREAVAMAADSAVTFQDPNGRKIFQSANKIFTLSKYRPVGIMVYGDALFMDIPWETVIKEYRRELSSRAFATLSEYAEDFLRFLREDERFGRDDVQQDYVRRTVLVNFLRIRREIDDAVRALLKLGPLSDSDVKVLVKTIVRNHREKWLGFPSLPEADGDFEDDLRGGTSSGSSATSVRGSSGAS